MASKPYSEACDQNREPILATLKPILTECKTLLEIGSGTGQHAAYFPQYLPHLIWQPSDVSQYLAGIELWRNEVTFENVLPTIELDVNKIPWPTVLADAVFSANTAHIMSWPSVVNFFKGVGDLFNKNNQTGVFCLYGPFNTGGNYTSESNERFDQWLKARDPLSGIRDIDDLKQLAAANQLTLSNDVEMPVNNRFLVFNSLRN